MEEIAEGSQVSRLAGKLLEKLDRAIGELDLVAVPFKVKTKEDGEEIVREFVLLRPGGPVDRQGLRQLTAVLKDLQAITGDLPELERKERLEKLRQLVEKTTESAPQEIRVVFDAGKEEWNE